MEQRLSRKEKQKLYSKIWYEKYKEREAIKRKEYYANNKEKRKEVGQRYYNKNKDKINALAKQKRYASPEKNIFLKVKHKCKQSGQEFSIQLEDIIIPEYCPLLGIKLDPTGARDSLPSLDRKDNSKGYIPGNVWVISVLANTMKNKATKEQLMSFAHNILKFVGEHYASADC